MRFFAVASLMMMGLSFFALTGSCNLGEKPPFNLRTSSPNRTYEIVLKEEAVISSDPFFTKHAHHEVRFTTIRDGVSTAEGELLYTGGT
jgi:hypothetical protein